MKVFVSSTYSDLATYRGRVLDVLTRCETIYHGMEFFGSADRPALDHCLSEIDRCDAVICILGTRYGSRPSGSNISYTEHEINHAMAVGKPIFPFVIHDDQPVPCRHFDVGQDAEALSALKQRLGSHFMPAYFTTPEDLALKIAQSLYGGARLEVGVGDAKSVPASRFRETAYDSIAPWYDLWYKDHWCSDQPFKTIRRIMSQHFERDLSKLQVLDAACGTGNTYITFKRKGFDITGCDASMGMLAKAATNCHTMGLDRNGILSVPINWTDGGSYKQHFGDAAFDVIVVTANSLCHVPSTSDYMGSALNNFHSLLRPGGILIVDTKRYVQDGDVDGVPIYKELRLVGAEWVVRTVRNERCEIDGMGEVHFHTRLHYDVDPAFTQKIPRALIVLTIYGDGMTPETMLIPYYPLPETILQAHMKAAGFKVALYRAGEYLAENWRYDVVVGCKPS
jgi:SAM-dependent methyltransferase